MRRCVAVAPSWHHKLLPTLPMRHWSLLLAGDEGSAPHWTAVAVSEPANRGRRRVWGTAEPMVRLCLRGERRGGAPHRHNRSFLGTGWGTGFVAESFVALAFGSCQYVPEKESQNTCTGQFDC